MNVGCWTCLPGKHLSDTPKVLGEIQKPGKREQRIIHEVGTERETEIMRQHLFMDSLRGAAPRTFSQKIREIG